MRAFLFFFSFFFFLSLSLFFSHTRFLVRKLAVSCDGYLLSVTVSSPSAAARDTTTDLSVSATASKHTDDDDADRCVTINRVAPCFREPTDTVAGDFPVEIRKKKKKIVTANFLAPPLQSEMFATFAYD